jgi:uncharacterized SAM-binding protein YcdF (DUF218 family)
LQPADPPSKVSYRQCIGSRNCKSGQGPTTGCRVIIIIIIIIMVVVVVVVVGRLWLVRPS